MITISIEELEIRARERGVPIYVILDELISIALASLN
jgi:hypothetical protein